MYHLTIYLELRKGKEPTYSHVPRVGDLLRVESIDHDVIDSHWGPCVVVNLVPEQAPMKELTDAKSF